MRLVLLVIGGFVAACQVPVTLDFPVPLSYAVSSDELRDEVPSQFSDGASLISVPCVAGQCGAIEGSELQMSCVDEVCNPEPFCYALEMPPVNLADYADLGKLGDHITGAEIRQVLYMVEENTLNVVLPPIRVKWGPETAATAEDESVRDLGVIPEIPSATTPSGEVPLDREGASTLGQYFVDTSTVFRLFADTAIDLEPGMELPQGTLKFTATVEVHLEGEGGL